MKGKHIAPHTIEIAAMWTTAHSSVKDEKSQDWTELVGDTNESESCRMLCNEFMRPPSRQLAAAAGLLPEKGQMGVGGACWIQTAGQE